MKNICSIFCFVLLGISCLSAQDYNVVLRINHQLSGEGFSLDKSAQNNLGDNFMYTRLEYYLSEFSFTDDAGNETAIEETWALINPADETVSSVDFGSHSINNISEVSFHVGVDEDHNHLDPSLWPAGHPLAPQFPSMHWGWASGYRFIALEGMAGNNLNQLFQLHGLGDNNYKKTTLPASVSIDGNNLYIDVDANYEKAMFDLSINNGVIVHGDNLEAKAAMQNFNTTVFSAADISSSTDDLNFNHSIQITPNPVSGQTIKVELEDVSADQFKIYSLAGRMIMSSTFRNNQIELENLESGYYILQLFDNGRLVASDRLIKN